MTSSQTGNAVLWECREERPACKIAVAGDFLPPQNIPDSSDQLWRNMAQRLAIHFQDVTVCFVNLECPITVPGLQPAPIMGGGATLSAPEQALDFLLALKAAIVGIANNHIYNYGPEGVQHTKRAAQERGMITLGAEIQLSDDPEVFVWRGPGDVKVGFWAAARVTRDPATQTRRGVEVATAERAQRALDLMKQDDARCRIALLHAGLEHTNHPDPDDVALVDSLAMAGFDVVAACHSHRIAGYRMLPRSNQPPACCFYGLGSLASDSLCLYSPLEREGLVVVVGLNSEGSPTRVEARPVFLGENGWGTVPPPETAQLILQGFERLSKQISDGSYQRLFYRDMKKDLISRQLRDGAVAFRNGGIRGLLQKVKRMRKRHVRRLIHALRS